MVPDRSWADTRLRGRSLALARAAWVAVAALALGLFVAGIPSELAQLRIPCPTPVCATGQLPPAGLRALGDLGLSPNLYAAYTVAMDVIFATVYAAVAALIFWRKSEDRMGLFVSFSLLTFGTATFTFTLAALVARHPAWEIPVAILHFLGAASFGLFLYLFPDGRFVPRWVRWVALGWIGWQLAEHFFPRWVSDPNAWQAATETVVWLGALGTVIYSQVHRYRHTSSPVERQQIKWVVFGISTAFAGFLGISMALEAFTTAPTPTAPGELVAFLVGYTFIGYLVVLLIPATIGIAMVRYHLFDVDLVINRTLVYGALTTSVVGIYILAVGGLGILLQARGNFLVSLLAAGLVAVLFAPLRNRLQRGVNHLMYGERDEPYAVLSRLGQRLEATLAPDAALKTIVETVAQALKIPYAAITLKQGDEFAMAAEYGTPAGEPVILPLTHQGEPVGQMILTPRSPGEAFTSSDRSLLNDLARRAGAAVHTVRLTVDLQRSRERLVAAREEERRRLRRDLHDGLGPQLAAQTLKAGSARSLYPRNPAAADTLLAELEADMAVALADVRHLVYNLRPPALDELGLAGAIREAAARCDTCVTVASQGSIRGTRIAVDAPERLPRLPAAVEVAAYRIVQEALTNVVRHADAGSCLVRISLDGALELEIADDGIGLPPDRPAGVGLTSMRERAVELGGACEILPAPTGGTRVLAHLPLPMDERDDGGSRSGPAPPTKRRE
ncbi:MAG TPA: GAF domain-containing sensor histidine kinase [Rubrobacter sp.]|nr:GAF domain-containing sensor histidine kinase [Rubrobacter sp.]